MHETVCATVIFISVPSVFLSEKTDIDLRDEILVLRSWR